MSVTTTDLVVGTGDVVAPGNLITVHFVVFDAVDTSKPLPGSPAAGESLEIPVDGIMLLDGWNEGMTGMKVGGKRRLTITPESAYLDTALPGILGQNTTLVFEVDLLSQREIPT
ncbi:MAG: FKBP-type peptidyl-prolyl cis-trans isomerase [Polyangiaceae bacterium]